MENCQRDKKAKFEFSSGNLYGKMFCKQEIYTLNCRFPADSGFSLDLSKNYFLLEILDWII